MSREKTIFVVDDDPAVCEFDRGLGFGFRLSDGGIHIR